MKDLSVIVQTCDRYSDLWTPFYTLLKRYWPDCPYPVYHVTESKILDDEKIETIATGDLEWSGRLLACLHLIPSEYVLLLLDDYFLIKAVRNDAIQGCLSVLDNNPNAACLRIFPVPGPDKNFFEPNLGLIDKSRPYAISTQATIWRKDFLLKFLDPNENVWQLEIEGSKRAIHFKEDFLSLKVNHRSKAEEGEYPYTYLCTAVYKGKWMKEAVDLCKKEGIQLDHTYRSTESIIDRWYRLYYTRQPKIIQHLFDFIRSIKKDKIKKVAKKITPKLILDLKKDASRKRIITDWKKKGKPLPPPHVVKQKAIESFQKKFKAQQFVETGTHKGDMVLAQLSNFSKIISIELSEKLVEAARKKFEANKHVTILQGDSGQVLPGVVSNLERQSIFWLDGHYSGGTTAKGAITTPVIEELNAIFTENHDHIILIDDARLFTGTDDYPTLENLKHHVSKLDDRYSIDVQDDIIRVYPVNLISNKN